jgi:two-component system repressor protein LuxO
MPARPEEGAEPATQLLLVDRDVATGADIVAVLASCLTTPPYVGVALSGKVAAELLKASRYDVVLIDLGSIDDLAPKTEDAVARLV